MNNKTASSKHARLLAGASLYWLLVQNDGPRQVSKMSEEPPPFNRMSVGAIGSSSPTDRDRAVRYLKQHQTYGFEGFQKRFSRRIAKGEFVVVVNKQDVTRLPSVG